MSLIQHVIDTANYARQAGFTGSALLKIVAIAGAESYWNDKAIGDVDLQDAKWGPSVGAFQIRTLKPAYLHMEPIRNIDKLFDPLENAKAAFAISKSGKSFKAWSTYNNGDYKEHETIANQAIALLEEVKKKAPILLLIIALIVISYLVFK